jgi:hypothetical protein
MSHVRLLFVALVVSPVIRAADITPIQADDRLRRAAAIAKETNAVAVLDRVLEIRDGVEKAFARKDPAAAERLVRDAEAVVEIDPGGKTMHGLPIAQLTPEMRKALDANDAVLAEAMKKGDAVAVAAAVQAATRILGESAGVPDLRRPGDRIKPSATRPADLADLIAKALLGDPRRVKAMAAGTPGETAMARAYAAIVEGSLAARPLIEKHQTARLADLDAAIVGGCKSILTLQLADGHFKFPDLRGKHLVLGDLLEKVVRTDVEAVKDGWIVAPVPDGYAVIDAAECGAALLRAAAVVRREGWTTAGLRAVEWARARPPSASFRANAAAVSLFVEAFRATADKQYLTAAWQRYTVGVAPGQTADGRWVDPTDAWTANHFLILRAVLDLEEILPIGKDRDAVALAAMRAVGALEAEILKVGVPSTANTVQELARYVRLHPESGAKVRDWMEIAATATVHRCTSGGRVRLGAPLPELAAVGKVWEK